MTAIRRLIRLLRAEPEPRPPYVPRHAALPVDPDATQPFSLFTPGDHR